MKKIKGKKMQMHNGLSFEEKDHNKRSEFRIKWWEDPSKMTYSSISVLPLENLPDHSISESELNSLDFHNDDDKMVFFDHYRLKGNPLFIKTIFVS